MKIFPSIFLIMIFAVTLFASPIATDQDDEEDIGEINLDQDIDNNANIQLAQPTKEGLYGGTESPANNTVATTPTLPPSAMNDSKKKEKKPLVHKQKTTTATVYYSASSSRVSKKDAKMLRRLVIPKGALVKIASYADKVGNVKANRKLARKRSRAVYSILRKKQRRARYRFSYGMLKKGSSAAARKSVVQIYSKR